MKNRKPLKNPSINYLYKRSSEQQKNFLPSWLNSQTKISQSDIWFSSKKYVKGLTELHGKSPRWELWERPDPVCSVLIQFLSINSSSEQMKLSTTTSPALPDNPGFI